MKKRLARQIPEAEAQASTELDAEITLAEVTQKLISDMAHLEPFGNENTQPVFYLKSVTLLEATTAS